MGKRKTTEVTQAVPDKAIIRRSIEWEIPVQRAQQDITKWRNAVISAESIVNPYRTELYRLYQDVMIDAHINAVWNARKSEILGTKFLVYKKGKIQADQTDIITKKWFFDFVDHSLDSKMWGFSLMQFGDIAGSEFTDIDLVPRAYVRPELNLVVPMFGSLQGKDYTKSPYKEWLIGVGDKLDLGLLMKLSPLYIWKKQAMEQWANFCQLFGVPSRVIKTDYSDSIALANARKMIKEMGSTLGAVIDKEDDIELVESSKGAAGDTFSGLIETCNAEISKLIKGESSSTDPKSFVGSVKIHEKVKDQIILQDIVWLENIFKYQLIPFLNSHNIDFDGCEIKLESDQQLTLQEKATVINDLLKAYIIPEEYIMKEFGIPVIAINPKPVNNAIVENFVAETESSEQTNSTITEASTLDESPVRETMKKDANK